MMAARPDLSRQASEASTSTAATNTTAAAGAGAGSDRKKRRDLLRDYYGIRDSSTANAPSTDDALDLDSQSFDAARYLERLSQRSLPDLLQADVSLLAEIRDLDSERQSLVYNHHHELIDASDTIRKMKSRALALDSSLESLKSSLESITQLSATLATSPSTDDKANGSRSNDHRSLETLHEDAAPPSSSERDSPLSPATPKPAAGARGRARTGSTRSSSAPVRFDALTHLPPLLALPVLLRDALRESARREDAARLWGVWEPALRSWEEEGIEGVSQIAAECREVLREGRQRATVEAEGDEDEDETLG